MKKHTYILHIGGGHTGKAVLLTTDHRAGSKAFETEAARLLEKYGFGSFVSCERVNETNGYRTRRCGPCEVVNWDYDTE